MTDKEKDLAAELNGEEQANEANEQAKEANEQTNESNEQADKVSSEDAKDSDNARQDAGSEPETESKSEATKEPESESERYMRLMAEFQNFKKRALKEKSDIHAYANEKIVNDLLPVLDNFERALDANPADDPEGYAKGMSLIFEQMKTALEKAGLKEIAALGETFDPNLHNAVMMEDSDEQESGKVSKVLQKGYSLNDKVVRPAMVSVAK